MSKLGDGGKYSDLFLTALRSYGMLCIGLYRLRDDPKVADASSKRYVIMAPPGHFTLLPSDLVYVLVQFDPGSEYTPHWLADRPTPQANGNIPGPPRQQQ